MWVDVAAPGGGRVCVGKLVEQKKKNIYIFFK